MSKIYLKSPERPHLLPWTRWPQRAVGGTKCFQGADAVHVASPWSFFFFFFSFFFPLVFLIKAFGKFQAAQYGLSKGTISARISF